MATDYYSPSSTPLVVDRSNHSVGGCWKASQLDSSAIHRRVPALIEHQASHPARQAAGYARRCASRRWSGTGPLSIGPDQRRSPSKEQSDVSAGARSKQLSRSHPLARLRLPLFRESGSGRDAGCGRRRAPVRRRGWAPARRPALLVSSNSIISPSGDRAVVRVGNPRVAAASSPDGRENPEGVMALLCNLFAKRSAP
jgi:hypothetical protein